MLAVPTTELWTPKTRTIPPSPPADASLRQIAHRAATFARETIKQSGDGFTAAYGEIQGGNCYAHAEATATPLIKWGIPNYIILNHKHASNFTHLPTETMGVQSFWFDSAGPYDTEHIANLNPSSLAANALRVAHEQFAKSANGSEQPQARYFWVQPNSQVDFVDAEEVIRTDSPKLEGQTRGIHIVVTGLKGIEMLHALGKLKAYKKHNLKKYKRVYSSLIDLVPTFRLDDVPHPDTLEDPDQ